LNTFIHHTSYTSHTITAHKLVVRSTTSVDDENLHVKRVYAFAAVTVFHNIVF